MTILPAALDKHQTYPLSAQQQGIFYISMLVPDSTVWNKISCKKLKGKLDIGLLKSCFNQVILHHPVLRTRLCIQSNKPVQYTMEYDAAILDSLDCLQTQSTLTPFEGYEILNQYYREQIKVLGGNLFSVRGIRIGKDEVLIAIKLHHIISDAFSFQIIWRDIKTLYNSGAPDINLLDQPSIDYRDYCLWQKKKLSALSDKNLSEYWLNKFKGKIPHLNLPRRTEGISKLNFSGLVTKRVLPEKITNKLQLLSFKRKELMYTNFLAMLVILLSRSCHQTDIVIGGVFSGRHYQRDLKSLVGCFVNTVIFMLDVNENITVDQFLSTVQGEFKVAYDRQDFRLEDLVKALNPDRSLHRNPLFRVMFNMVNMFGEDVRFEGLQDEKIEPEYNSTQVDLLVNIEQQKKRHTLSVEFNPSLFNEKMIDNFIDQYIALLRQVSENQDQLIAELSLTDKRQLQAIRTNFNDTQYSYPNYHSLLQVFEQQVERTPHNTALVYGESILTYEELNHKATNLAATLSNQHIHRETLIGIMTDRSFEMLIGILGILKAGYAYLPIDPDAPLQRIRYILENSKTQHVLYHAPTRLKVVEIARELPLNLIDIEKESSMPATTHLRAEIHPQDLAYVIYTSGSTGLPKGVMIEHGMVLNTLLYMQKKYPLSENDAYLLKTAYTFDVSLTELFGWCFDGGKLVILPKHAEKDPNEINRAIQKHRITHINFAPSMLKLYLYVLKAKKKYDISSLRYVFSAGEELESKVANRFYSLISGVKLENLYGPTEASIYATKYSVPDTDTDNIFIGKPLLNTSAWILDSNLNIQPIGIIGELCLSGKGVARGYYNNQTLSNEKFIDSPFQYNQRLYKTGDLAILHADGNIEYRGRLDDLVKLRGYRIELREISSRLSSHAEVKEAVATIRRTGSAENIVLYFVSENNHHPDCEQLREYLKDWLPQYMMPTYIIEIKEFPLNTNGKIDKNMLPEATSDISLSEKQSGVDVESSVLEIIKELVNAENISMKDSFFDVGGTSLVLIEFITKVEEKFGVTLPVLDFIDDPPVIGHIVNRIETESASAEI